MGLAYTIVAPISLSAVAFGHLVRTLSLCEYFADANFRNAIRRVLSHDESVHQPRRLIRPYAIGPKRGPSHEEQRAISGSSSLLSNLVITWNMQKLMHLPDHRRPDILLEELAAVKPVATRHINFRGVLHFPLTEFAAPALLAPVKVPATP